jgi:outer membrane lipoprotein carrier protein
MKIALKNSIGWVPPMISRQNPIAAPCQPLIFFLAPPLFFIDGKHPHSGALFEDRSPTRLPRHTRLTVGGMVHSFCLLLLGVVLLQGATTADELIKRVETRYNAAQTLSVDFVESYSMQGHPRPPEEGKLTLRKERKMRWDYSRPAGKLFISDGKTIFLYSSSDNRVEKMPLKNTEDMRAPLAFLLGRLDMKKEFRDFTARPADGGTWLAARSKSDRTPYENVDMLISDDGAVRELKIVGRDQSLLAFSFKEERLNSPASDSLFHFTIPSGAEVVDSVNWGGQEN